MVSGTENGGIVNTDFDTMQLPGARDVVAPDGSDVRILLQLGRGGMAHAVVGVTMPPWPGPDEAYEVDGAWPAEPFGALA
jgi:hypothetical protein